MNQRLPQRGPRCFQRPTCGEPHVSMRTVHYLAAMSGSAERTDEAVGALDVGDRPALLLAGVGAVLTVALVGLGPQDPWSSLLGVTFLATTWASHRAAPSRHTPRSVLVRIAFGSVSALCILLALKAPLAGLWFGFDRHGVLPVALWLVLAAVISLGEPRIAGWLDKERRTS